MDAIICPSCGAKVSRKNASGATRTHCSICREPLKRRKRWGKKPKAAPPPEQFPTQPQPESRAPSFGPDGGSTTPQPTPPASSPQPSAPLRQGEPQRPGFVPTPELISPGSGDNVSSSPTNEMPWGAAGQSTSQGPPRTAKASNPLLDDVEPSPQNPELPLPPIVTRAQQRQERRETTASNHELSEDELRRRHLEHQADKARAARRNDTFEFGSFRLGCAVVLFLVLQVFHFARMPANPTPTQIGFRVGGFVGGIIGIVLFGIWDASRKKNK